MLFAGREVRIEKSCSLGLWPRSLCKNSGTVFLNTRTSGLANMCVSIRKYVCMNTHPQSSITLQSKKKMEG